MRAVLDSNVIVSALIAPRGAPGRTLAAWRRGEFEVVVSPALINELARVLEYPRIAKYLTGDDAAEVIAALAADAVVSDASDVDPPVHSRDGDDDYLLALAAANGCALISGDLDLCELAKDGYPIYTPAEFLDLLVERD